MEEPLSSILLPQQVTLDVFRQRGKTCGVQGLPFTALHIPQPSRGLSLVVNACNVGYLSVNITLLPDLDSIVPNPPNVQVHFAPEQAKYLSIFLFSSKWIY